MLDLTSIVTGRLYVVRFLGPLKMNKGGRMGVPVNPYLDRVTKSVRMRVQAVGRETYERLATRDNPDWTPSGRETGFEPTEHPCLSRNAAGELHLNCRPVGVDSYELTLDGKLVDKELFTLWLPPERPRPLFMRVPIVKIENAVL